MPFRLRTFYGPRIAKLRLAGKTPVVPGQPLPEAPASRLWAPCHSLLGSACAVGLFAVAVGCLVLLPCVLEATTITFSCLLGAPSIIPIPGQSTSPGEPAGIAVDATGNIYVAGRSRGGFPTLELPANRFADFVLKIDPATSKVLYSTPIVGAGSSAIVVDQSGNVYLTGQAGSGFVTTPNAYQKTPASSTDGFVAKLGPDGQLIYATFLGGREIDQPNSIAVDAAGNVYVVGMTSSDDFPVTPGALQTSGITLTAPGGFVSKLSADGSRLIYSTYLRNAFAEGVAVDWGGNAYVTGYTYTGPDSASPPDFPTTPGAFQPRFPAGKCPSGVANHLCSTAFVIKLNAAGSAPVFSTFLGGTSGDAGHAIAVDSSGNCYVAGNSGSPDFPTNNPFQASFKGGGDAFLVKLDKSGASLAYSTFFGGRGREDLAALALDPAGNAYLAGRTFSPDLPLRNPMLAALNSGSSVVGGCGTQTPSGGFNVNPEGCADAFLAKFDAIGSLAYSTYFGGLYEEYAAGVATDGQGLAYVIGEWSSGTAVFPAVGPLQNSDGAGIFVIRVADSAPLPLFSFDSVVNAASLVRGTAPGGLATVFGTGLVKSAGIIAASGTPLPRQLDGVSVEIDGVPAPLLAVANVNGQEQINYQVPSSSRGRAMVINNNGARSLPILPSVVYGSPGVFAVEGGLAAIQHSSDFRLVTANNPAARSEIIVIYATGLGVVDPDPGDGNPAAASPLSVTRIQPAVTIGGKAAEVLFSGLAPGFVGLNQVNVRVPESTPSGSVNLVISVSLPSQSTFASKPVTLFVR